MDKQKGNTLIPAVVVIVALAAAIGVFAFSIWPKDEEFDTTSVRVKNTNSVSTDTIEANTNGAANTNDSVVNENTNSVVDIEVTE